MNSIGFYADLILNRLQIARALMECADDLERDGEESKETAEHSKTPKRDPEQQRRYITQRLRDIEKFERSYGRKT